MILSYRKGDAKMSAFTVEECLITPDKQGEYKALMQRLLAYRKENPKLFKEVKSFRLFHQIFGCLAGAYIKMWEFDSMTDLEKREMKESETKNS